MSKYFWWFECVDGGDVSSFESCTGSSVLQLHIKDNRDPPTPGTELNLNMFPWGLALQDLKDFTGLTISDLDYRWLGRGGYLNGYYLVLRFNTVSLQKPEDHVPESESESE